MGGGTSALLNALKIKRNVSGSIASFDDGADGVSVDSLKVNIEPVQSGSGDPSPDNVRPISGWDSVSVTRTGINLIDQDMLLAASGWVKSTDEGFTEYGNRHAQVYKGTCANLRAKYPGSAHYALDGIKPNTRYVAEFWWRNTSGESISGIKLGFVYTDGTNSLMGVGTAPDWTQRMHVSDEGKTVAGIFFNYNSNQEIYMAGLIVAEYDPDLDSSIVYSNELQKYDITLPSSAGTVYSGSLEIQNDGSGMLTSTHKTLTLNGSETWNQGNYGNGFRYYTSEVISDAKPEHYCLTSISPAHSVVNGMWINIDTATKKNQIDVWGYAAVTALDTIDKWKAYITANPATVCYKLATPITYTLTASQVTTLLGTNNIWADTGDVEVNYTADATKVIEKLEAAINSTGG